MGVLVSAGFSFARENVVFDEVDECVGYGGAVVVEASSCQFAMDFAEAFSVGEPSFFPQFLDYASAGFGSWRLWSAFSHDWVFFEFLCYGC